MKDHGIGVTDDERRRVFEPFLRSPQVRREGPPGLGLGLSIATRLVDAMGGRIDVLSEPGVGTAFSIVLRAADETSSATPSP